MHLPPPDAVVAMVETDLARTVGLGFSWATSSFTNAMLTLIAAVVSFIKRRQGTQDRGLADQSALVVLAFPCRPSCTWCLLLHSPICGPSQGQLRPSSPTFGFCANRKRASVSKKCTSCTSSTVRDKVEEARRGALSYLLQCRVECASKAS